MNRYQEAIDLLACNSEHWVINRNGLDNENCEGVFDESDKSKLLIQELVDKATPKKPVRVQQLEKHDCGVRVYLNVPTCPVCKNVLYENECCRNNECRQAIDWYKDGE